MNGYNFTERVRQVLAMSREEAAQLRHEYVGTEHVLLGIIREGEGIAATVLQNLGTDLGHLRGLVTEGLRPGQNARVGPDLPYTSRAKKALEFAMAEARELNHAYVGTEHLLLGLLREERGIAAQVLVSVGITLERAREETLRILGTELPKGRAQWPPPVFVRKSAGTWHELSAPLIGIIDAAFARARSNGASEPTTADLLQAIILSSPGVSAAFTKREIEIDSLIADVREASEENPAA